MRWLGMESGHRTIDEMKDKRDQDESDEQTTEKEFAGVGLVGFEK